MEKIDFLISGVWKDSQERITHVLLHKHDNGYSVGYKQTEAGVIRLISLNKNVMTMTWNYPDWRYGAKVIAETRNGRRYLKTIADNNKENNLDNLINMSAFPI